MREKNLILEKDESEGKHMKIEDEKQVRVKNSILKKDESESKHIKIKERKK